MGGGWTGDGPVLLMRWLGLLVLLLGLVLVLVLELVLMDHLTGDPGESILFYRISSGKCLTDC